jgi:hypothetical protein
MAHPARHNVPLLICSLLATQVFMNTNIGADRPSHTSQCCSHGRHRWGWRDVGTVFPVIGTGAVLAIHLRKERSAIALRLVGHGLGLKSRGRSWTI